MTTGTQAVWTWRAPLPAAADFGGGRYWSPEWVLAFGVTGTLLTGLITEGKSLYGLLGLLGLYMVFFWRPAVKAVAPAAALFALPVLAVASALWSEQPAASLRHGLQLGITVFAAVLVARRTPGPALIGATFCALLLAGLLSLLSNRWAPVGFNQGWAFIGIFGSKNEMAVIASLLAVGAAAATTDRRQPGIVRLAGVFGLVLAALLLRSSQSLGAVASTLAAGTLFAGLTLIGRLRLHWRALAAAVVLLAAVPALAAGDSFDRTADAVLVQKLGKNWTFTGRTYLWQRAEDYIERKPVLGHGFQAFWRRGSLEAEGLWRYADITSRQGFNFHNQYVEVLVELGWVGLVVLVATLAAVVACFAVRLLARPTPTAVFAASGFLLLLSRTPMESITLVQFSVPTFFLFLTSAIALSGERPLPA